MKDKKLVQDEAFERRWLYHAKQESVIFEAEDIKEALKEGWKFWPWELEENKEKREYKKKDKKEEVTNFATEVDCKVSSNPEVTVINDSVPHTNLVDTISKEEIDKCLQRQQQS